MSGQCDWNLYEKYTLNLHVQDIDKNDIANASVVITDSVGTVVASLTTDISGNIVQTAINYRQWYLDPENSQEVDINNTSGVCRKTSGDFTITISATGYQTKTMVLTMDRKREEVVVLEKAVKFITAGGDPVLWNLQPTNSQNKHKWTKV